MIVFLLSRRPLPLDAYLWLPTWKKVRVIAVVIIIIIIGHLKRMKHSLENPIKKN